MSKDELEAARAAIELMKASSSWISESTAPSTPSISQSPPKLVRKVAPGSSFLDSDGPSDTEEDRDAKRTRTDVEVIKEES